MAPITTLVRVKMTSQRSQLPTLQSVVAVAQQVLSLAQIKK
jgi:hypothetical protein